MRLLGVSLVLMMRVRIFCFEPRKVKDVNLKAKCVQMYMLVISEISARNVGKKWLNFP